jgi:hypothetical protein
MTIDIFGIDSLGSEERTELIRRGLHNLTSSYADEADIFTEIIQNAVDAIEIRLAKEGGNAGSLKVILGRRATEDHYLYVQDNGTGMTQEIVDRVFIPGFSNAKKKGKSIGYKGVGMSYVVAVSDHMAIRTVANGATTDRTIRYTSEWVRSSENPTPDIKPEFNVPELVSQVSEEIEQGTGVYFSFHPGTKPQSLKNLVIIGEGPEKEVEYWANFLSARSAIGLTLQAEEKPPFAIDIEIVLDLGEGEFYSKSYRRLGYDISEDSLGYPFPHQVYKVSVDKTKIDSEPPATQVVKHRRKHPAIFYEWSGEEIIGETDLDQDEKDLLLEHLEWVNGWLCHSTKVLEKVNTMLGTRSYAIEWGARLAVDGVPQGRQLGLKLTSDTGLDRQTHIVVGLRTIELDTGRKIIADERLSSAIDKVTSRVVTLLKEYRWALRVPGTKPVASDLDDWVSKITERAGNSLLPKLFEPDAVPPARVNPEDEQEVIALWTGLVVSGKLPGFEMRALSGFNRYDGLVNITGAAISEDGPLAVLETELGVKQNAVIEFKGVFDGVITDFEQAKKIPSEIDLLVCWDCPDLNVRMGSMEPVYGKWSHKRTLRGASYLWQDDSGENSFPVIALRNVVAELLNEDDPEVGGPELAVLQNRDEEKLI